MSQPPVGQGPIDPQGVFSPPPAPGGIPPRPPGPPPGFFGQPMPMMPPFYPPPRQGKSFARTIFTTLASTIFGISILLNLYLLLLTGLMHAGESRSESVLEKGDPNNRIIVLPINGIINEKAADGFRTRLKTVEDDATCKALVIEIDSPGGSVTASDDIYHQLMLYKAKSGKPIIISQGALAASGGYYISCAGDYILAQPSTLTGNIGVLLPRFNLSKMLDKWGVEETTLKAKGSPYKNAESMFQPESLETNNYLQTIVDGAYVQFRDVVIKGRGTALKAKIEDAANGKIYTSDQALALGLIDQIDYPEVAYAIAAKRAGLGAIKPTVVRMKESPGLMDLLTGKTGIGPMGSSAQSPDLGTVNFNGTSIDAGKVYDLLSPRLMYLWNGN